MSNGTLDENGPFAERKRHIDAVLLRHLSGETEVDQAATHLPRAGGKRLRPLILLLVGEAYGADRAAITPAAAAVEATHTFTLIDDDLPPMDGDKTRRGVNTVHERYGEDTAILASDYLEAQAFSLLNKADVSPRRIGDATEALAGTMEDIARGQQMDMAFESAELVTFEQYETMARLKTGSLYRCSGRMGAILAGALESEQEAMAGFGASLGIAFQMIDDLLDITSDEIGKDTASDLKNGKTTALTISAREAGLETDLCQYMEDHGLEATRRELESRGCVERVRERADTLIQEAMTMLKHLPDDAEQREGLEMICKQVLDRNY